MKKYQDFAKLFKYSLSLLFSSSPVLSLVFVTLVIVQGIMPSLSVLIGIHLINAVGAYSQHYIFLTCLVWVATFVFPGILAPSVSTLQSILNQKATYLTQKRIMTAAERLDDLKLIENEKIHNDFEALSREASNKPLNLLINLVDILRDAITLISLSIIISTIIWWLPLVLLFPLFPVALTVSKSQKDIFIAFAEKSKASRLIKYYISVTLNTQLAKELKVFNLYSFFIDKHKVFFSELENELNSIRKKQIMRPQKWNLLYLLLASSVMYWFSTFISEGKISSGELLGVIQAITYFALTCQWGVYSLAYLSVCFEFFRRLYDIELMSSQERIQGKNLPEDQTIEFHEVSFGYNDTTEVVSDLSFKIEAGQHIAIIGENGAGKSTIIKLLCRLYTPTSGKITMGGTDINDIDIYKWRENISAIFQDFGHYCLTVKENIVLGEINNPNDDKRLKDACEKSSFTLPHGMDYTTFLGKEYSGAELSGGQWQRLAIARALYSKNGQILIMDEPTSSLDPRVEAEFFRCFIDCAKDRTSITVTHRLGSIRNADIILVIKNGTLVESGTPNDLLKLGGEYFDLLTIQRETWVGETTKTTKSELSAPLNESV